MNHSIIIRAEESDYREIRALWLQALAQEPQAFKKSYLDELLISENQWKHILHIQSCETPHDFFMVAKLEGSIVGMIGAEFISTKVWKLHSVYVDQCVRGQGIGRALVSEMVQYLECMFHASRIELVVNTQQISAIRVYRVCGFVIEKIIQNQTSGDGKLYTKFYMSRTSFRDQETLISEHVNSSECERVRSHGDQSMVFFDNNILPQ